MELTQEILLKNGFETNHSDRILPKFYIHGVNPEYRIVVESVYAPELNSGGYKILCQKCNDKGLIIKESSVGVSFTVEDLQRVIDLCEINKEIIL